MSTIQVLILSIFIAFLILENYGYGYWMISRPIFAGQAHRTSAGGCTDGSSGRRKCRADVYGCDSGRRKRAAPMRRSQVFSPQYLPF